MIKTTYIIQNDKVIVLFIEEDNLVSISVTPEPATYKLFAGIPDLKEYFDSFKSIFKASTTYNDAITFFSPNTKISL